MKAWVTHGFGDMRLEEVPDPKVRPGWAIVKVKVVQPSVTEVQLFQGERSSAFETVVERLERGPQLLFGHEFTGEIIQLDKTDTPGLVVGDRVAATHSKVGTIGRDFPGCFAELAAIPVDALAKVPSDLTDWEAAALQPLSSCVRNVQDLHISLSDVVVVLGQGVMGLNSSQAAKAAGAEVVIGVDRRADVLRVAKTLGVDHVIDASQVEVRGAVQEVLPNDGASIVIEAASGSPTVGLSGGSSVTDAVALVRQGGKILSVAHYHQPVALDFNVCRKKRLTYLFPQTRAGVGDMQLAARLIEKKKIQVAPMITHMLDGIEAIPEAMDITANKAKYGALNPAQVRFY